MPMGGGGGNSPPPGYATDNWRNDLSCEAVQEIQSICERILKILDYKIFRNSQDFKDLSTLYFYFQLSRIKSSLHSVKYVKAYNELSGPIFLPINSHKNSFFFPRTRTRLGKSVNHSQDLKFGMKFQAV